MSQRDAAVGMLLAKQQITERILDYCRGVDRGDRALMGSAFWPKATIDHPPFQGHAEEFCDAALEFIRLTDVAMHSVSNIRIEIEGDRAYTESYFTAFHRLRAGLGASGVIAELLCPHHRDDIDEDHFIGGRYIKWLERRGDEWRIFHHIGFPEWERWEPAADRTAFPQLGRRDHSDPSYRRA